MTSRSISATSLAIAALTLALPLLSTACDDGTEADATADADGDAALDADSDADAGDADAGTAPTITPIVDQVIDEDTATPALEFSVGDDRTAPGDLQVTVVSSDEALLPAAGLMLGGEGALRTLSVTPAADAFGGPAIVTLLVVDEQGERGEALFSVTVSPVNDPPTTTGLGPVTVYDAAVTEAVVDLHAAFDDVEDGPEGLVYEVVENSNPVLFSEVAVDAAAGTLTLRFAEHVRGHAEVVVRATDSAGAPLERRTRGSTFPVYDDTAGEVGVERPDAQALGLSKLVLLTSWAFFESVGGVYVVDHIDEDQLRTVARDWIPQGARVVCDIEDEVYFGNDALGRDNLARVLDVIREERPDIESLGYYRLLPERQWWAPVSWRRAERDLERDLDTYFTTHAAEYEQQYDEWRARNALYRTEPLSADHGGGVVADRVSSVFPSLYTFYRNVGGVPDFVDVVAFDPAADTVTVAEREFVNGTRVRLQAQSAGRLPTGLADYDPPYVVIDAAGTTFRLAESDGGPAVDLADEGVGTSYVGSDAPWDDPFHDPDVVDWRFYAEENVAEARLYGVPTFAYVSPSFHGRGEVFIEHDFFRFQLEVLYPLVDGIVVWGSPTPESALPENHEWWDALAEFMAWVRTVDGPATSFLVSTDRP